MDMDRDLPGRNLIDRNRAVVVDQNEGVRSPCVRATQADALFSVMCEIRSKIERTAVRTRGNHSRTQARAYDYDARAGSRAARSQRA